MIEVIGLEKSYAGFPALKNISFTVPEGEVTGFLGPNGAGKTTTLRILSGFMPATQGTVRIDGLDVRERSRDVRRRVGYLPRMSRSTGISPLRPSWPTWPDSRRFRGPESKRKSSVSWP